jgi:hypothetical protein
VAAEGAIPIHLLLGMLLAVGWWFDDDAGRLARLVASLIALLLVLLVMEPNRQWFGAADLWIRAFYPLGLTLALIAYGRLKVDRWLVRSAIVAMAIWAVTFGIRTYDVLRHYLLGIDQLAWGLLFFILAALISLRKAGWLTWHKSPAPPPAIVDLAAPEGP